MRPPLLLTGGPAAGKSTTGADVLRARRRAAMVEVDDLRRLVVRGGVAPWDGTEGRHQQHLGVENACDMVRRFVAHGLDVVIADVVSSHTLSIYRARIGDLVCIELVVSIQEARRRSATRHEHLKRSEFDLLHRTSAEVLAVDHRLLVDGMDRAAQAEGVDELWRRGRIP